MSGREVAMPFAAGLSIHTDLSKAVQEATAPIVRHFEGRTADLTFVFVSHAHERNFDRLPELLHKALPSRCQLGCSAEAVIAAGKEIESGPSVAVWSAVMPDTDLVPFHLHFEQTPDGVVSTGMPAWSDADPQRVRAVIVLGEPYSSAPVSLLERLEEELPGVPVIGGMASGATSAGDNRLFMQRDAIQAGAVAVAIRGGPAVRALVSQGCRPIGAPFLITHAEENVVAELGGRPALERLQEVYEQLSPHDRELLQEGVHLGLAINEYQEHFAQGDFLIANVLGARRDTGAIAVGNLVRTGQTVQFHVRDADSADDDLRTLLARQRQRPAAALLFSCNGRGTRLFPSADHDASAVQNALGPLPLAGFFASGELGPVGGRNFIHGFTASVALFDEK
jgi:small ligand-binding sensory domain FIST